MQKLEKHFIESIQAKYGPHLTKINLSNNGLRNVDNICMLGELVKLNLSRNDIVDTRALAALDKLEELNLAENRISFLAGLESLHRLEVLDLSGNELSSLEALRPLFALPLTSLRVQANALCLSAEYPGELFRCMPSLQSLDEWRREDVLQQYPQSNHRSSPATVLPAHALSSSVVLTSAAHSKVESLETQVLALHDAFDLQERNLSSTAAETVTQNLDLFLRRFSSLPHNKHAAVSVSEKETRERMQHFPYLRLLQCWRQKVLQSKVSETLLERSLRESFAAHRKEREKWQTASAELETQLLKWKNKSLSLSEQCESLRSEQIHHATAIEHVRERERETARRLQESHKVLRSLVQYLSRFRAEHEQHMLCNQATVVHAQQQLAMHMQRLESMNERLQFLQSVLAEKEIEQRNTAATLEAERRLLHWRYEEKERTNGREEEYRKSPTHTLGSLALSVESEALLKTLFRQLDSDECGLVSAALLLRCIVDADALSRERKSDFKQRAKSLTPVGALLSRSLGETALWRMVRSLRRSLKKKGADHELSWGECMLLLVPLSSRDLDADRDTDSDSDEGEEEHIERAALSPEELRKLQSLELLAHIDIGVLPLVLPKSAAVSCSPSTSKCDGQLVEEVNQLRAERAFLLRKLQAQDRSLTRRAESIKSFFDSELRALRRSNESLAMEKRNLEERLQRTIERVETLEKTQREAAERQEALRQRMEEENESLRERLRRGREEDIERYEILLNETRENAHRLQQELLQSERESSKREVKTKALQRDLLRLQNLQSQHSEKLQHAESETAQLQTLLQEKDIIHKQLILSLEEKEIQREAQWLREKEGLMNKISELQEQMLEMKSKREESIKEQMVERELEREDSMKAQQQPQQQSSPSFAMNEREREREMRLAAPRTPFEESAQRIREEMQDIQRLQQDRTPTRSAIDARLERLMRVVERAVLDE